YHSAHTGDRHRYDRRVREIVLVISDLYLPPAEAGNASKLGSDTAALPGLEYLARFGQKTSIHVDWRSWLARWLGRDDLATIAPAAVAAAAQSVRSAASSPSVKDLAQL